VALVLNSFFSDLPVLEERIAIRLQNEDVPRFVPEKTLLKSRTPLGQQMKKGPDCRFGL
jgi:hypothetical protein